MDSDKEVLDGWCMYEERSAATGSNASDSESIEIISEDEAGNYQIYSKKYFKPDNPVIQSNDLSDCKNRDISTSIIIDTSKIQEHSENDPIIVEEGLEAQEKRRRPKITKNVEKEMDISITDVIENNCTSVNNTEEDSNVKHCQDLEPKDGTIAVPDTTEEGNVNNEETLDAHCDQFTQKDHKSTESVPLDMVSETNSSVNEFVNDTEARSRSPSNDFKEKIEIEKNQSIESLEDLNPIRSIIENTHLRKRKVKHILNNEAEDVDENKLTNSDIPTDNVFMQTSKNLETYCSKNICTFSTSKDILNPLDLSNKTYGNSNVFCRPETPSNSSTDEIKAPSESASSRKQKKRYNNKRVKHEHYTKTIGRLKNTNSVNMFNNLAQTDKFKDKEKSNETYKIKRTDNHTPDSTNRAPYGSSAADAPRSPEPLDISTLVLVSIISSVLYLVYSMILQSTISVEVTNEDKTKDVLDPVHGRYLQLVEDWEARVLENAALDYQIALREGPKQLQSAWSATRSNSSRVSSTTKLSLPHCLASDIVSHAFGHLRQFPPDIHDLPGWRGSKLCVDLGHLLSHMRSVRFSAVLRFLLFLASPGAEIDYRALYQHYLAQQKVHIHDVIQRDYPEIYRSNAFHEPPESPPPATMYCLSIHRFSILKEKYAPDEENMEALIRLTQLYVQDEICLTATVRGELTSIDTLFSFIMDVLLSRSIATAVTLDPSLLHDYYLELILSNQTNLEKISRDLFKYNVLAMRKFNLTRPNPAVAFAAVKRNQRTRGSKREDEFHQAGSLKDTFASGETEDESEFLRMRDGDDEILVLNKARVTDLSVRPVTFGIEKVELFYDAQMRQISNGYSSKVRKFLHDVNGELKRALCHPYVNERRAHARSESERNESLVGFIRDMCRMNTESDEEVEGDEKEVRDSKKDDGTFCANDFVEKDNYLVTGHTPIVPDLPTQGVPRASEADQIPNMSKAFDVISESARAREELDMEQGIGDVEAIEELVNSAPDSAQPVEVSTEKPSFDFESEIVEPVIGTIDWVLKRMATDFKEMRYHSESSDQVLTGFNGIRYDSGSHQVRQDVGPGGLDDKTRETNAEQLPIGADDWNPSYNTRYDELLDPFPSMEDTSEDDIEAKGINHNIPDLWILNNKAYTVGFYTNVKENSRDEFFNEKANVDGKDELLMQEEIDSFKMKNPRWGTTPQHLRKKINRRQKGGNEKETSSDDKENMRNNPNQKVNAYDGLDVLGSRSSNKYDKTRGNTFHGRSNEHHKKYNAYDSPSNEHHKKYNAYDSPSNEHHKKYNAYDSPSNEHHKKYNAYDHKYRATDGRQNARNAEERVVHIDGNENKYTRHVYIDNVNERDGDAKARLVRDAHGDAMTRVLRDAHGDAKARAMRDADPEMDFWLNRRARLRAKLRKKHFYPMQSNPEYQYDYMYE